MEKNKNVPSHQADMEFSWHVDTLIYRCFGLNLTQTWFKRQTWLIGFQVSNGGDSWNFSTKHFTQRDSRVTPLGHDSEDSHSVDWTRLKHLVNSTDKWTLRWKENIATKIVNYTKTTVETSCKLTWEIRNSNIFQWFLDGVLKQRHEVLFRHLDAFEKGRPPGLAAAPSTSDCTGFLGQKAHQWLVNHQTKWALSSGYVK